MKALAKLGTHSTAYYQQQLRQAGFTDCPTLDCDFAMINAWLPDQYEALQPLLAELITRATAQGITRLLFPNITLHHFFYLYPASLQGITLYDPFVLLTDVLAPQSVYVLGSRYTPQSPVLKQRLQQVHLESITLDASMLTQVDEIRLAIYDDGCLPAHTEAINKIVRSLSQQHTVIIACSELSIALTETSDQIIDLAALQIEAFINPHPSLLP